MSEMDEAARLQLLADYGVLDTGPDATLNEIVALASAICEAPVSLISLVDETRQWFKARFGIDATETPREQAFCAHVVTQEGDAIMSVRDAREDPRFVDNPLVTGDPRIVFYGGAPLIAEGGLKLGTLCVIDMRPRELTPLQEQALTTLAAVVVRHLGLKREIAEASASTHRLETALQSIGDAVITTDEYGRVTMQNPVAEALTGWSSPEARGVPLAEVFRIVHEETRVTVESPVDRVLREGIIVGLANHTVLLRRDGTEVPIDDSAAPIRAPDGRMTGVILVFRDVTERKRAEREREALVGQERVALAEAQTERDKQHALFMQAPVAIAILDGPEHRFTFANPAYRALVNGRDVLGKRLLEALPDLEGQGFDSLLDQVMRTGQPFRGKELPVKLEHHTRDEVLFIDFVYTPKRDAEGTIDGVLVSAHDVTELVVARQRAETLATQSQADLVGRMKAEADLQRMFDLSQDLISISEAGYFKKTNPAFQKILGWSADELKAEPIASLVHPDDSVETASRRAATTQGGSLRNYTARYRHKDGTYRWLSWSAIGEQGISYAVGRDVTQEQAMEEAGRRLLDEQRQARDAAEKAAKAMDEFLATVSHELRTPLNAMLGWTRLLRGGQIEGVQQSKALETIERNAVLQAQLIEDLLDVSRIISGKMRLDVSPVDLVAVIEAALDVVRPAAEAKQIQLHALLDPGGSHVAGDASRLQQIVWNLLSNAVKFTPKGGRVRIQLVRDGSSVEIETQDTGQGISEEFLPHVFERFRQADGAISRSHGGLGLGLAIVKNLVELHGGTVQVESAGAGLGSTFRVRLPLSTLRSEETRLKSSNHPSLPTGAAASEPPPELARQRILVVDDDADARELVVMLLRQCGAVVTPVASARQAIEAMDADSFDVVVSDLGMPIEDGYDLIKQIRARPAKSGGRVPVIALTAYARAEDRTRTLRAGFDNHVSKPVEPSELLAVLVNVTERASWE